MEEDINAKLRAAIARVEAIPWEAPRTDEPDPWLAELMIAFIKGMRQWAAHLHLGRIRVYHNLALYLEPKLTLPEPVEKWLAGLQDHGRMSVPRVIRSYIYWVDLEDTGRRDEIDSDMPDPYEPLLQFWEMGGSFWPEHGDFFEGYPHFWSITQWGRRTEGKAQAQETMILLSSFASTYSVNADGTRPRKQWTRQEVAYLIQLHMLPEKGWELLDGEIVYKVRKSCADVWVTQEVFFQLAKIFGMDHVQSQSPIQSGSRNEPEPDVSVMRRTHRAYYDEGNAPDARTEVLLTVEVSDTTLTEDRNLKALLYARLGIPEYWVVDINGRRVFVHRDPQNGVYQEVREVTESDPILPLSAPAGTPPVVVSSLLP